MDSDKAKKWITLGANLGVLIGIFLLIVELQQNREMMRAQTRTDVAAMSIDRLQAIASDQGLADIVRRARFGEELGDTESTRYLFHTLATFRTFENVHYQYRQGMYDDEEFSAQQEAWRGFVTNTAYVSIWCAWRETFSPEFRVAFEALFRTHTC